MSAAESNEVNRTRPSRTSRRTPRTGMNLSEFKERRSPTSTPSPRAQRPERGRAAQAGVDLQDPPGAGGEGRAHLRRGRAGGAAGRLRVPARPRLQLPAGPGRHLRVALPDPAFDLRTGDTISGQVRPPKDTERYFALLKVEAINFETPEQAREKISSTTSRRSIRWRRLRLGTTPRTRPPGDGSALPHRQGTARHDRGRAAHR